MPSHFKCSANSLQSQLASMSSALPQSFTAEFTEMIHRMAKFRAKAINPSLSTYQPRYAYIGKIKKGYKWKPIDYEDVVREDEPIIEREERKVGYCILVAYCGANYVGSQRLRNYSDSTIEEMLLQSLWKNKWITAKEYRIPHSVSFETASRTDKGVSAMGQCYAITIRKSKSKNMSIRLLLD